MSLQKSKTVKLSSKNQITLPPELLTQIDISKGDYIQLVLDPENKTIIIKNVQNPIDKLRGIMKKFNYSTNDFLKEKKTENKTRNLKLGL
jgi:bifunctional DNA-binding transcriptional regulator/antitoxin component of YhaV-PrlF toxin-antitoxin module